MMMVSNLRCVQNNVINAFTAYTCITYHLHIFKCFDQFHGPVTPMCATGEGVTPMGQSSGITPTKICETPSAEWIFGDGSVRVGGTHLNTRGLFYYPLLRPSSPCHTHSIYRVRDFLSVFVIVSIRSELDWIRNGTHHGRRFTDHIIGWMVGVGEREDSDGIFSHP